jgi:hypothetical protein
MSWLLMWIREHHGTDKWRLKHVVDMNELFGHISIKVGSKLCDAYYKVIIVHAK